MTRFGLVVDLDKCSGCQACQVACSAENNLAPGTKEESDMERVIRWIRMLPRVEGTYPDVKAELVPMMCQQCDRPPCVYVCPVSATYRNPQGIVAQIYWRCIGCRYCVNACPYTDKYFNWWAPVWPGDLKEGTNPNVSLRPKGVTEKCTFCFHRLQEAKEQAKAEGRPLRSQDYVPACVGGCPTQAMVFGDLDDPKSTVAQLSSSPRAVQFLEELGTKPKVIYLKEK